MSAAPPNIELARKAGETLDRAARSLLRIYGPKLAEMESYFPGLTEEVRTRVLGRAEYWKGVALLNALHTTTVPRAQDAGSSPTATPAQLQAQPTAESTGAASEAPAPPQPEAAGNAVPVAETTPAADASLESLKAERKKLLDDYKAECKRKDIKVTNEMISRAASQRWHSRTQVQKWLCCDPDYDGEPDRLIRKVFEGKPHLKPSPG